MEKKRLNFEVQLTNLEEYNESFLISRVPVCYSGFNRNKSHISKECADNMFAKAGYVPVVAEMKTKIEGNEETPDFGSHGGQVVIDEDGIKYVDTTIVIGCVINEPYTIEKIDGKDYYTVKVALYKEKYPQIEEVIRNSNVNQSMEIALQECEFNEDGYLYIEKANLTALCLLSENVEPCFEGSQIQTFANKKDKFEFEYTEIVEKVKSAFAKDSEDTEDLEEETPVEDKTSEENKTEDVKEEEPQKEEDEFVSEDDEKKKCEAEEKKKRCKDESKEEEPVIEEPVEDTEETEPETEDEDEISKEEYEALIKEFANLQAKYEALEEEVKSLRAFKKEIDDKENKAKVDELCSQFNLEEDEIREIKNKAYSGEMSLEKLEDKLFALMGRKLLKNKNYSNKEKNRTASAKIKTEETIESSRYGSLTKYLSKN